MERVSPASERVSVTVDGRELSLSNLAKPMYPATGFTKGELIDYYAKIAPVMLPHLSGRPVTTKRFPNGVEAGSFIEKNVPRHAPDWVRTVVIDRKSKGADTNQYAVVDDLATLVWFANLASIEFHTPMWRIERSGEPKRPDLIVFDLDPGEPASIVECCQVALLLRDRLASDRLALLPKTSGSKGLQLYGALGRRGWTGDEVNAFAHEVAEAVETDRPQLVVSRMTKSLRRAKILIDWSQNNPAKTTVTPYSMRALREPSVSTPVTWDEVERCASGGGSVRLSFTPDAVLERVENLGDLFAALVG
jgi:bifunctional non-homologous end joining protein LigD